MDKELIAGLIVPVVGEKNIRIDELMKRHTSFKVGGPADVLVEPANCEQVARVMEICRERQIPVFVMGNGTNLLVRDKGIRGVVIKLQKNFSGYVVKDDIIEAEAGILISRLSHAAMESGLSGLEFASGIPGTLGGAVVMNAGAYDGEMKNVVVKTEYLDKDGQIRELEGDEHGFGYRESVLQKMECVVLKTHLKLAIGDRQKIREKMDQLDSRRKNTQPLELPSAGSVFKRPVGYHTGPLIEGCNLKGYRIGGAEVSAKHCGFIVNAGNATAQDIIELIKFVQENVKLKYGIELQTEIKIVGEE